MLEPDQMNAVLFDAILLVFSQGLRKNKVLNMSDKLFERYVDMNWRKIDADNSGSIDFEEYALSPADNIHAHGCILTPPVS